MSAWSHLSPADALRRARTLDALAGPDGIVCGAAADHRDALRAVLEGRGLPLTDADVGARAVGVLTLRYDQRRGEQLDGAAQMRLAIDVNRHAICGPTSSRSQRGRSVRGMAGSSWSCSRRSVLRMARWLMRRAWSWLRTCRLEAPPSIREGRENNTMPSRAMR
jgi:hypothetical protein